MWQLVGNFLRVGWRLGFACRFQAMVACLPTFTCYSSTAHTITESRSIFDQQSRSIFDQQCLVWTAFCVMSYPSLVLCTVVDQQPVWWSVPCRYFANNLLNLKAFVFLRKCALLENFKKSGSNLRHSKVHTRAGQNINIVLLSWYDMIYRLISVIFSWHFHFLYLPDCCTGTCL